MSIRILLASLIASTAISMASMASAQTAGEYITAGGWGRLVIEPSTSTGSNFSIQSYGANGHSCGLEDSIQSGVATIATSVAAPNESCVVVFSQNSLGVLVSIKQPGSCREFCGTRASFDGQYLSIAPA